MRPAQWSNSNLLRLFSLLNLLTLQVFNLEKAVRQGVRQYVILGAGMDNFAFRCPEMLDKLQVFEVDHPAMQAQVRETSVVETDVSPDRKILRLEKQVGL
jgi:hypothetical protein